MKLLTATILPAWFFMFSAVASQSSAFAGSNTALLLWQEDKKLTAADTVIGDLFGISTSISGNTVVVGSPGKDNYSGCAYIFERSDDGMDPWSQVAKLIPLDSAPNDLFGFSVGISADTVIVGSFADDDAGSSSGSAYIFERNHGGTDNWGQVVKLTASDGEAQDQFGGSVSISGDIVIVGSNGDDDGGSFSGSAYIFERHHGGSDNWGQVAKLSSSDASIGDNFGIAVSVSRDTVVVGAIRGEQGVSDSGSAYIFQRNYGGINNWGQVTQLTASDATTYDQFGGSVAISGETVVVGAEDDDDGGTDSGSAYIFTRDHGGTDNWGQVAKLTALEPAPLDQFGEAVAISGDTVVAGSRFHDNGSGSAYLFSRHEGGENNWGQVRVLSASDDGLGISVAVRGGKAVVGATLNDGSGTDFGSAYVFREAVPFLSVPISGDPRIEKKFISAVVDHHVPTGYNCNSSNNCGDPDPQAGTCHNPSSSIGDSHRIISFDGTVALQSCGENDYPPGYRQDCAGSPLTFDGAITYLGVGSAFSGTGSCGGGLTESTSYLNYDGHSGTDFAYPFYREITAPADGIFEIPATDEINGNGGGGNSTPKEGYNTFRIIHANGLETWYLHALEGSECLAFSGTICESSSGDRPAVGETTAVASGQVIALVGNTGTSGAHLHFEVRKSRQIIDPFGCDSMVQEVDPAACIGSLWIPIVVFADGFESGNTSRWSSTTP